MVIDTFSRPISMIYNLRCGKVHLSRRLCICNLSVNNYIQLQYHLVWLFTSVINAFTNKCISMLSSTIFYYILIFKFVIFHPERSVSIKALCFMFQRWYCFIRITISLFLGACVLCKYKELIVEGPPSMINIIKHLIKNLNKKVCKIMGKKP